MKKFLSLALALVLVLSMSTVAFASESDTINTYDDMTTVTLTKEYKLTNADTTSPAEIFQFSELICISVTDAADGVVASNAPVPTIESVSYSDGEAGSKTAKKDITITLPTYTSVGIYTYTFTETDGGTAGVTYRSDVIKLVVTVIEQNGKVRVAAVHTEGKGDAKSSEFNNEYSAGSLYIKKNVTGNMGDLNKEFTVKVTFTAPDGDTVKSDISYTDGTEIGTIPAGKGWTGTKEVEITLKHDETVTFTNIPYGVTYTVVENDYTDNCYDAATYDFDDKSDNKEIDSASENVTITNNKSGTVDTGINMDNIPYILLLAVACIGLFVFIRKKHMMRKF